MKTIYLFASIMMPILCLAQDDGFCICMLNQPAYSAEQDQTYTAGNEFNEFLSPQILTEDASEDYLFMIFEEDANTVKDEDLEEVSEVASDRVLVKKKKKRHYLHWNAHKKPKKYKGKCPFF